jgi:hypothetical protein
MEELLNNYIRFIEEEMDNGLVFDPDRKIRDLFDDVCDEMDFRIATVKFEMEALIDIPRSDRNYDMTLRELVTKISELPKAGKANVPALLKKKKSELAKLAQEMAASMQSIFG